MCPVVLLNLVLHYSNIVLRLLSKLNMIWCDDMKVGQNIPTLTDRICEYIRWQYCCVLFTVWITRIPNYWPSNNIVLEMQHHYARRYGICNSCLVCVCLTERLNFKLSTPNLIGLHKCSMTGCRHALTLESKSKVKVTGLWSAFGRHGHA